MTIKLKLVDDLTPKKNQVTLHQDVLHILFEHRRYIKSIFLDIRGHYDIAHMGMSIIAPSGEVVAFSSTPSIEYNLIQQNFWKDDHCFSPCMHNNNTLSWWDADGRQINNEEIKRIKLIDNRYKFGMTLARQLDDFCLLYSYATESIKENFREYYTANTFGLIDLGDYFYKSTVDIYSSYSVKYKPPRLVNTSSKSSEINPRSSLRLVVDNLTTKR